ncbi:ABC transporter ATP-binding protein [Pelagibius litoralis]|uniref:ABC transporter ATP-binding protein n=1 Tax=Pelagibius litoralis TaxID=374515 RepID=A0A967KAC0_9PROT|nr:ABC transporter ATP-binding protein [Pelagibius litoralis]NIA70392.1 ABC transporter ATP-binding protein [Pelagibius litoralis]
MSTRLLSVRDLGITFLTDDGEIEVLRDVSFELNSGEVLGIVGESGCGKSMTALALIGLIPKPFGRISNGRILLEGEDLAVASEKRLRQVRGNDISMVFQEPMTSLNPVFTVGHQISETLRAHFDMSSRETWSRAIEMLKLVGIPSPEKRANEYPHQLSGGMRQRVMIAIALVCEPKLLIADEPTTALDVTVQAEILQLFRELQEKTGTAIILITHDIGVVAEMADRVMVMYAGKVVETGTARDFVYDPMHPYTHGLISCVPKLVHNPSYDPAPLLEIPGVVPSLRELKRTGCPFAPRCKNEIDKCRSAEPSLAEIADDHAVACWNRMETAW